MTDIPASTSTTASITVGGTVQNLVDVPGDHDWFAINLTAGQQITISLSGSGANPLPDPYVDIRNASGTVLAWNDDSGGSLNSKLVFSATTTGTYFIDAGGYDSTSADWNPNSATPNNFGGYTLSVQPYTPPPVWTYDQIANQLVSGYWTALGDVPHHWAVSQGGTITVNYSTLTAGEQTLAKTALQEWSDIIGITFTPVTTGGQIMFSDAEDPTAKGPVAQTSGIWSSSGIISSEHVDISASWVRSYGSGLNSYSFQTYLHEIGHALGLGHAGNYNNTADYTLDALYANDGWPTTVMSYFDQVDNAYFHNQGFTQQFVVTPMDADIVAMQQLYGLSTTTRAGNTTYGFNSNAGGIYDASTWGALAYTIFDSGGNNTLDYSGYTSDQLINLNPETFSNVGTGIGNVMIARGTIIQNAIGGSGNDTIIANNAGDHLTGNAGNDTLIGGAGDDFLTGGPGIDTLTGGAGNNTFQDTLAGLNGDTITDFHQGDKIVITNTSLSGFTFNVTGTTLTINSTNGTAVVHLGAAPSGALVAGAATGGVQLTIGTASSIAHHPNNDFNGDGHSDILWRSSTGQLSDWLGQANGGFVNNDSNAFTQVPTNWQVAGTGDFNGDGKADVLWRSSTGQVSDWLGTANGGFSNNDANAYTVLGSNWQVVGVSDFNGDGRADILWRNTNGTITDWLGQANGGFTPTGAMIGVTTNWTIAGTGDFNGDGRADILWRGPNGEVSDWLANSSGGWTINDSNALSVVPTSWHVAGVGDFNGDGISDILWRSDTGQLSDWLGQPNGGFINNDVHAFASVPTNWHVAAIGDFNGDGIDDILWRSDTGQMSDWLGRSDGGFTVNDAHAAAIVSTSWHPEPPLPFV